MKIRESLRPDERIIALLKQAGSLNKAEALAAQDKLAVALAPVIREGVLYVDNLAGIFERVPLVGNETYEQPLDFLSPGEEDAHIAYSVPGHGRIPENSVEGDYVKIGTYQIANSIDMLLRYARDAGWNTVMRAIEVLNAGFTKKIGDDGWHTILAAGVTRNIAVYDADAAAGQLTKRLVSMLKTVMTRQSGGNGMGAGRLTDIYMSPEGVEDILNWGVDQLDDTTRRMIHMDAERGQSVTRLFGVNIHGLYEFGKNQEYQLYYSDVLGGTYASSDVELVIGLDLSKQDSFIMPVREDVSIFADDTLHRQQRMGWYGWYESGCGVLDNRRVITATF